MYIFLREIMDREFSEVLFSGVVVSFSGVDFVLKVAEVLSFAIYDDRGPPFFSLFEVPDAPVFRRSVYLWVAGVSGVVGGSGWA